MLDKKRVVLSYVLFFSIFIGLIYFIYLENGGYKDSSPKSYSVYIDEESQTFRDEKGRRVYVIEKNGQIYLPLSGIGDYLNYTVEIVEDKIVLHKKDVEESLLNIKSQDILTENMFSNDDIYSYDRTIFIVWASWCPDCEALLREISENYLEFEKNNIQLVGIPIFTDEIGKEETISKIKSYNLQFKNILVTDEINSVFLTNLENIPAVYIADNKGRILGKSEETNILYENIIELLDVIQDCNEC